MQLNKTSGTPAGNLAPEKNAQSVRPQKTPTPVKLSDLPSRSVSSVINSLGLPQDKLSTAILSFARFFSLPLKPNLMADIRRQTFAQQTTENKSDSAEFIKNRETVSLRSPAEGRQALSLAAAAAESKGVELTPKGLEFFAEAVDPDLEKRHNSEGQGGRQRSKNQDEPDEEIEKIKAICDAAALKKMALESSEKNPLLSILNKLPCKSGQRWIVIPFDFHDDDRSYRAAMRILLESEQVLTRSSYMALDITETGETEKKWLFVLEAVNNQISRLSAYVQDELFSKEKSSLERNLSSLLSIPLDRVSVKRRLESFPFEAGFSEDFLPSIDEAV